MGMILARFYDRIAPSAQARFNVVVLAIAGGCCCVEGWLIMTSKAHGTDNSWALAGVMMLHAVFLAIPYYVPAFVFAARFGGEDTALVVTGIDGIGYMVS